MIKRDLIIVGGGPAGMAAAVSAFNSGVDDILLLERDQYLGGILNQCIHTGFGIEYFKEVLSVSNNRRTVYIATRVGHSDPEFQLGFILFNQIVHILNFKHLSDKILDGGG